MSKLKKSIIHGQASLPKDRILHQVMQFAIGYRDRLVIYTVHKQLQVMYFTPKHIK